MKASNFIENHTTVKQNIPFTVLVFLVVAFWLGLIRLISNLTSAISESYAILNNEV
jgi:hypothetical protein